MSIPEKAPEPGAAEGRRLPDPGARELTADFTKAARPARGVLGAEAMPQPLHAPTRSSRLGKAWPSEGVGGEE